MKAAGRSKSGTSPRRGDGSNPNSPKGYGQSSPKAGGSPGGKSEVSLTANELLEVKQDRKKAESDLQLLANRIALLKTEEQKALHKITDTKARATEILQ